MSHDPLDKTTSIGAELTPTGLNLNAKSRFIAALDRFCGNVVDLGNVPMERNLTRDRAKIEGEQQLIQAMTKAAIDRMGTDPEFAERAIQNHLGTVFTGQRNKDGVMRHVLEDLRRDPAADEAGPELDPGFMNRFERHAEDAATEELREKWARVLATEIRKPGTVTTRVMRMVDEIDAETAQLFEELCASRIGNIAPTCLVGELDVRATSKLVGAGLLVDPGFVGQVRVWVEESGGAPLGLWFVGLGKWGISIPRDFSLPTTSGPIRRRPLRSENGKPPAIPVYIVTDEGLALSRILPDREEQAYDRYIDELRRFAPALPIKGYASTGDSLWQPKFEVPLGSDNSP